MTDSIVIVSAARTPIGGLLGDFSGARCPPARRGGHPGRGRTRRGARRRHRRGAHGQLPDGRPGPGACPPGRPGCGPAAICRCRHAVQDVRLWHARHDVRPRHAARGQRRGRGGGRHGEHDQRAAPHVRPQGRALRRRADVRPHGDGRPGRRLRARPGHGRVCRRLRGQVRLHPRGAGRVCDRLHAAQQAGQRGRQLRLGDRAGQVGVARRATP